MFYQNQETPPEFVQNIIKYELGTKWVFCSEGCSTERISANYQLVGSFNNASGFFINAENPFNRRYKTNKTHSFKLYKRKP